MARPILSGNPSLVPFTAPHVVTPGGLLLVAIFFLGSGFTSVGFGCLVPMGPTVSCLGETAVYV